MTSTTTMGATRDAPDQSAMGPMHATGPRRDIADMVRLVRFVKGRRASLMAQGQPTGDADALLRTLEQGLRSILPFRRPA